MIEYDKVLSLEFYNYKGVFTGSIKGMRYRLAKAGEEPEFVFEVYAWEEPYNFDVTPEEKKEKREFLFSEEGKKEAVDWLNKVYKEKYR